MRSRNRPVVTRFVTWSIIICIPVVLVAGCKKDIEENQGVQTVQKASESVTCLNKHLGLILPDDARDLKCHEESLMLLWVFSRFEVSHDGLKTLLLQEPLSKLPPLSKNPELVKELQVNGSEIVWWLPSEQEDHVTASQVMWRKPGKSSDWECVLRLCVGDQDDSVIVYIQYSEEPVSRGA